MLIIHTMVIRFSSSFCVFVCFDLWLQVNIHERSCFVSAQSLVFLLGKSHVYLHCCLLLMVESGVFLLDWLVGFGDGEKMWELGL